jgi:hypothetical protein
MGLRVADVVEKTGISRANVYRRKAKGETLEEILAAACPGSVELPPPDADAEIDQSAVEWAHSILWAAKHVNEARMSRTKAGSQIKYAMWEFGRDNAKELVVNLVPKALTILDKNKKPEAEAEIEAAEKQSISELKELLAGALKEAGLAA